MPPAAEGLGDMAAEERHRGCRSAVRRPVPRPLRRRSSPSTPPAVPPKRITVSLPDELVEKIKRAAGGKRQVSSYVATALEDYQERETLDDILAAWREETPVPQEVQRQVEAELDHVGLTGQAVASRHG
jgi:predicted transcriptional regulator